MQDNPPLELQVVMPVYNEESAIGSVIDQWCAQLDASGIRYSILAIDDGSKDGTPAVLESLRAKYGAKLEPIRQKNAGHGQAILRGYQMAVERGVPWIFQIDSDGQCDPQYFPKLWETRTGQDIVTGYRKQRDDGFGRVIISTVLRCVVFLVAGVYCRDANVPYRLMRTGAVAPLVKKIPPSCFFTNVGLSVLALRAGLKYAYIPIRFRVRTAGETTVPYRKMVKHAFTLYKNLRELLRAEK